MSFIDKAKDKAADVARELGEKVDTAVEKGGELVDEKTKGRPTDQVDEAADTEEEPPPSKLRP